MSELSPVTSQWESLFNLYLTIGSIVGAVVIGMLILNAIKYREGTGRPEPVDAIREGRIPVDRGTVGAALILTLIVAAILFTITIGTMATVDFIEKPPKGTLQINVEGFQWNWKFIYPNGKQSVGEVRIPVGETVIFYITSTDVFHKFQLVEFKIGVDAIPGKVNKIWIKSEKVGEYTIQCYELCGVGHALMKAKLIVMPREEFNKWYKG